MSKQFLLTNSKIVLLQIALLALFLIPLFLPTAVCAEPPAASWDVKAAIKKPAPEFTLTDTNGKTWDLADCKGKFVVLEWFNQECPFVKKHYESGNMQKMQKDYTDKGVIWLSICSSAQGKPGFFTPAEHNKMFADKNAAPTAILLDTDGKVGHLYGAKSTPDMFVIDPKGILVYAGAIDNKPSTDVSDVASAKNYVKSALDACMAGRPVPIASTKSYGCSVKYE